MERLILLFATGFGSGRLPKAPGTWGSLVGVGAWLWMRDLAPGGYAAVVAALFLLGVGAAGATEKLLDRPDPGLVVIDEIVGQLVALWGAPHHPVAALAGFLLFRLFDIWKPFPVGWADSHFHGGIGIMLDDVLAGCWAAALLWIAVRLWG